MSCIKLRDKAWFEAIEGIQYSFQKSSSLDPPPINPGNATTISYSTNDDLNDFHT